MKKPTGTYDYSDVISDNIAHYVTFGAIFGERERERERERAHP